jgi:maleamate amidohydrolase
VIDSFSYNFRTAVVEDGCFDRSQASHAINLFDMHAKYADVVKSEEAIEFLRSLAMGMFELPAGIGAS